MTTRYVCPKCGSDDIDAEAWVSINDEIVGNFAEGGDNFCNGCDEHFKYWCVVDVATGKCVECYFGTDAHGEDFKPLENIKLPTDEENIQRALRLLIDARDLLRAAGAPKSTARVRLVISSVKGALRNVGYRKYRPERKRIKRAPAMRIQTRARR